MEGADSIGRNEVVRFLSAFYAAVRRDPDLGPLFDSEIDDWDAYISLMADFWCDALVKGPAHPIPSPPALLYGLDRGTLARWRTLFSQAVAATLTPEQADRLRALSQRISELQSGL